VLSNFLNRFHIFRLFNEGKREVKASLCFKRKANCAHSTLTSPTAFLPISYEYTNNVILLPKTASDKIFVLVSGRNKERERGRKSVELLYTYELIKDEKRNFLEA
jgi:hypothetical protein